MNQLNENLPKDPLGLLPTDRLSPSNIDESFQTKTIKEYAVDFFNWLLAISTNLWDLAQQLWTYCFTKKGAQGEDETDNKIKVLINSDTQEKRASNFAVNETGNRQENPKNETVENNQLIQITMDLINKKEEELKKLDDVQDLLEKQLDHTKVDGNDYSDEAIKALQDEVNELEANVIDIKEIINKKSEIQSNNTEMLKYPYQLIGTHPEKLKLIVRNEELGSEIKELEKKNINAPKKIDDMLQKQMEMSEMLDLSRIKLKSFKQKKIELDELLKMLQDKWNQNDLEQQKLKGELAGLGSKEKLSAEVQPGTSSPDLKMKEDGSINPKKNDNITLNNPNILKTGNVDQKPAMVEFSLDKLFKVVFGKAGISSDDLQSFNKALDKGGDFTISLSNPVKIWLSPEDKEQFPAGVVIMFGSNTRNDVGTWSTTEVIDSTKEIKGRVDVNEDTKKVFFDSGIISYFYLNNRLVKTINADKSYSKIYAFQYSGGEKVQIISQKDFTGWSKIFDIGLSAALKYLEGSLENRIGTIPANTNTQYLLTSWEESVRLEDGSDEKVFLDSKIK